MTHLRIRGNQAIVSKHLRGTVNPIQQWSMRFSDMIDRVRNSLQRRRKMDSQAVILSSALPNEVIEQSVHYRDNIAHQVDLQLANAILKFELDSRNIFDKHEKSVRELRWFKGAALTLGGTVVAAGISFLIWIDNYVDGRIAKKVIESDRMVLALNQAQFGRWRDALAILDEVRRDSDRGKAASDPEFRQFLYDNLLWVLAGMQDMNPDGSWVGQQQYEALIKDEKFVNAILTRETASEDPSRAQSLAICTLKYDQRPDAPTRARAYLEHAATKLEPLQSRADVHWQLGMLHLALNSEENATKHLLEAANLHPYFYNLSDLEKYRNSFLNASEFQLWNQIATRTGNPDFESDYRVLTNKLAGVRPDSAG